MWVILTCMLTDGTVVESYMTLGQPYEFHVGVRQTIRGLDEGIMMLAKKQKAQLTCPPDYAYGARGNGDKIPPNATLIIDVELYNFEATITYDYSNAHLLI